MQVFIVNEDIEVSVQELDDRRLTSNINEIGTMIKNFIYEKVNNKQRGYSNHPVYKYYKNGMDTLVEYLKILCKEYEYRFNKEHSNIKIIDNMLEIYDLYNHDIIPFAYIKGIVNVNQIITTENVYQLYKKLLLEKYSTSNPKWTSRTIPNWVEGKEVIVV